MAMARPYRPPKHRTAETRETKAVNNECADCQNTRYMKPNGEYARLCKPCLDKDAARAKLARSGGGVYVGVRKVA